MTNTGRSPSLISKGRPALFILLIAFIVVVALLLVRGRHPKFITSIARPSSMSPANHPVGTPDADIPTPKGSTTGTVEVCGYGKVPTDKSDASAVFRSVGALTKAAGTRWLSALQNSDNPRARVAGLMLEGKITGSALTEQTRNDVVQLAAGSDDPAVYAMALSMCDAKVSADSACRQLSLQRWAQLEPDNAVPWLLLAGRARVDRDSAAEAEAFSHAALAQKVDSYSDSLLAFTEPELPPDVTPLERAYLATEVIGVEAAMGSPQYRVASQRCSADSMQDNKVQQQCNSLAELLVTKGANLVDLSFGRAIGARAGWPNRRVEALAQEQHALMWVGMEQALSENDQLWTCDAVSRLNARLGQTVQRGELGAARDLLEKSGDSVEQVAQRYTQYMDNITRDALTLDRWNSPKTAQ
jgi:hypothetical protein